jgi:eukaryotic-like serine/threonine-protein kinase
VDFIVSSGRALVWPGYKGSYERWDPFLNLEGDENSRVMRTRMFEWRQDLGRTIDLLSSRQDIDANRVAYLGISFGASVPLPLLALESRLKTAVLLAPGFSFRALPPEADGVNYASRITMPVLMVGGRHDYVLPYEMTQRPLFEQLGTPANQKRHVVFEAGHVNFPRAELIREVLAWLDRYLGPVDSAPKQ